MNVMKVGTHPQEQETRTPNYSIIERYFLAEIDYLHFRDCARDENASEDTKLLAASKYGKAEAISDLISTFYRCGEEVSDENINVFVSDREDKLTDYEIKYLYYVVNQFHAE